MANSLTTIKDYLHAQFCYQLFITPIYQPLPQKYRPFAVRACKYLETERSDIIHIESPRHHVIHRFKQPDNPHAKKILITHGWMSRAAYMASLINVLHNQGFDIYALDFPAHGESKGVQLPWTDAVSVLQQTLNQLGPFYGVIGHSFGGSMLLNTLNLASQYPEWKLDKEPERVVLLASPTRMHTPVGRLARQFKLTTKGYLLLRKLFREESIINLKCLDFRHYTEHAKTPFLCVHGTDDEAIIPEESILFCKKYPHASLSLLKDIDHVSILMDERVEQAVSTFLAD